ncbi:hypothetical protein ACTXT7_010033 [Hymenolepis weldensis]
MDVYHHAETPTTRHDWRPTKKCFLIGRRRLSNIYYRSATSSPIHSAPFYSGSYAPSGSSNFGSRRGSATSQIHHLVTGEGSGKALRRRQLPSTKMGLISGPHRKARSDSDNLNSFPLDRFRPTKNCIEIDSSTFEDEFDDQPLVTSPTMGTKVEETVSTFGQAWQWFKERRRITSPPIRAAVTYISVEYAIEAVGHAPTCIGIIAKDGIVLAGEKRFINKLLDESAFSEKIFRISDDIACAVAGITADATVLIQEMRLIAQRYFLAYQEPIPVEQLVSHICDLQHGYTMYGGRRPFGVSMLFVGWDKQYGYQLYQNDPSGNFLGWKATCIGSNSSAASSILEADYNPECTSEEAVKLCVKVLYKTMTMSKLTSDKLEIGLLQRKDDKTYIKIYPQSEVDVLIKEAEIAYPKTSDSSSKDSEKKIGNDILRADDLTILLFCQKKKHPEVFDIRSVNEGCNTIRSNVKTDRRLDHSPEKGGWSLLFFTSNN